MFKVVKRKKGNDGRADWTVLIGGERRGRKDERQRKRRGDIPEKLLSIATAGYCR